MNHLYIIAFEEDGWIARVRERWGEYCCTINEKTVLIYEEKIDQYALREFCGMNNHDQTKGFVAGINGYTGFSEETADWIKWLKKTKRLDK